MRSRIQLFTSPGSLDSMNQKVSMEASPKEIVRFREIENREWWLWAFAVTVTIVLVAGVVAITFPGYHLGDDYWLPSSELLRPA